MIYFDNASTTKIDKEVREVLIDAYDNFWANPSALHSLGFKAEKKIRESRKIIAKSLSVKDDNILFVPSATAANNAIIRSVTHNKKGNILISGIEHNSVFKTCYDLENIEVRIIDVDKYGFVDEQDMLSKIDENTIFITVLHVSNEIGTINDINRLSKLAKEKNSNIIFHSDGVQAFKKIDVNMSYLDFYTIASHKINGPKGIAAFYLKDFEKFQSYFTGGGQEKGKFAGTENVQGIVAFAKASELDNNSNTISDINKYIRTEVSKISDCLINSPNHDCSNYILNVCFKDIGSEILLHALEMDDVYVSSGSACNKNKKSRVLNSIGVCEEFNEGCIRISFDRNSTMQEAQTFVKILKEKVDMIRRVVKK